MINKKIIIDDIDVNALNSDEIACMNRYEVARLFVKIVERLVAKEQENEELRQYHNKCCEEFKKEKQDLIDKYNQLSINFYNGDYCNTDHCSLLKSKEKECERLEQTLIQIKDIAENVQSFVGRIDIEDDVFEQMEQILQKISEMNHDL